MTVGKIIAWNNDLQRGIIESRMGETFKVERKDFVNDLELVKEGLEVVFESYGDREVYGVESNSGQFYRFHTTFGGQIA